MTPEREHPLDPDATVVIHTEPRPAPPAPGHRARQYGILSGLVVLVIVFAVILVWLNIDHTRDAQKSKAAATKACAQVVQLGQPCAAANDIAEVGGVSGDAVVPNPVATKSFHPVGPTPRPTRSGGVSVAPTDAAGVPQAFQPAADAGIVAMAITGGHLILTYDDGARVDAGLVKGDLMSLTLGATRTPSPSPVPVLVPSLTPVPEPSVSPSPEPVPVPSPVSPSEVPEPSGS